MTTAVLFLDAEWRPLRVEPWTRAFCDLVLGKVEVIEYSKDRMIQGVSRSYEMPSVVRDIRRFKRDRIRIKFSRINIYTRDKFICQYCHVQKPTEDLTFDHVVPRSQGGRTTWENIVTCCLVCNSEKADRTPEQAGVRLLAKPKKPHYLPAITVRNMNGKNIPKEWRTYWNTPLG